MKFYIQGGGLELTCKKLDVNNVSSRIAFKYYKLIEFTMKFLLACFSYYISTHDNRDDLQFTRGLCHMFYL